MDPNTLPNQPVPETPQPTPVVTPVQQSVAQPQQPYIPPQPVGGVQTPRLVAKAKSLPLKIIIGVIVIILIAGGVSAYVMFTSQKASDTTTKVVKTSDNSASKPTTTNSFSPYVNANNAKAITNAQTVSNVAEVYFADSGFYPASAIDLMNGDSTSQVPKGITIMPGAEPSPLNATNGTDHVTWSCLVTCTETKGGKITYWDYTTSAVSTDVIYAGDATVHSTFVNPAS
ncbi:MAG: hypothetical protein WCH58_01485 [Candidatus Saccharibacteria bacterium]